ncbi:ETO1-like 1 [Wolffia australiana]
MRNIFLSDSCRETQLHPLNPQAWLQVERGKLVKPSPYSSSSIESLIKVAEPPILPFFKPVDYVQVLAQIHEELESCPSHQRADLCLLQFHVFKGLGEGKLLHRCLLSACHKATSFFQKLIFQAWVKYEKQENRIISDLLASCEKSSQQIADEVPTEGFEIRADVFEDLGAVFFRIGEEVILCERRRIAALSEPFHTMLYGSFTESRLEVIDMSNNGISVPVMREVVEFSRSGRLGNVPANLLLEILVFSNKFFCEKLRDACDRTLATFISSTQDAIDLIHCALEENSPILAITCFRRLLHDMPGCLKDKKAVDIFCSINKRERALDIGHASFSLYCFLCEVALDIDPRSETAVRLLACLVDSSSDTRQKQLAYHQLGCVRLLRKEYSEAEQSFAISFQEGHVYSAAGLARIAFLRGERAVACEKMNSIISSCSTTLGWMYQERSLYMEEESRWADLVKATELDPALIYPYMYRAATLMRKQDAQGALAEVNRVIGFKLALECLELRFCFYLALEDYRNALCDIQAILTLSPKYRMFEGRVAASQLRTLVSEHVAQMSTADCWMQLYDRWSSVDDIGSLSVIYQMLETDVPKGVLYFRQSLLLLRLNCPEAAMRSLQLARENASNDHERLVYEGWILYDSGYCEEGLQKAEESIKLQRSFEAFFFKAYALADSSPSISCSDTIISLLEDALKCPSDRLRKGQALNNLGSVYVDCQNLDLAAECYINALKIRHTRAHQGLARVHFLMNNKNAAYEEMARFIEKAPNNASAYEKRSEYCDRDLTMADLDMVTRLDPLRVYPYRYRAAVLMDSQKEKEAIAELTRAIAFKADLHLLHLRAAFYEHIRDVPSALRDCRAALSVDPNHQEMLELRSRVNCLEP